MAKSYGVAVVLIATCSIGVLTMSPSSARAGSAMTAPEIFHRCYLKIAQAIVPRTPSLGLSLLTAVQQNRISATDACVALLEQVEFSENAVLKKAKHADLPKFTETELRAVISNFQNFHSSWFTQKSLGFLETRDTNATLSLRDSEEPSLYFTRSLFGKNTPVSSVFTTKKTLYGLRVTPDSPLTTRWQSKPQAIINETLYGSAMGFLLAFGDSLATIQSLPLSDDKLVGYGHLLGVYEPERLLVPSVWTTYRQAAGFSGELGDEVSKAINDSKTNVNLTEHLGGGILGSQAFILKNTNLEFSQIAGGGSNDLDKIISRRISSRVFTDLLCHQLPTLTESDVVGNVIANSPHAFRQSTSCMTCHTSIDPMAYTYRNVLFYLTSQNNDDSQPESTRAKGSSVYGVTKLKEYPNAKTMALRQPAGALNYRDHTNLLHQTTVSGLEDLAANLASSDDFYRCVAQRYYAYFTGFEVNLTARNVPLESNTAEAKRHRAIVYMMGENLKKTQSLLDLIREIFSTEAFQNRVVTTEALNGASL